jgi:hypothetical protein
MIFEINFFYIKYSIYYKIILRSVQDLYAHKFFTCIHADLSAALSKKKKNHSL